MLLGIGAAYTDIVRQTPGYTLGIGAAPEGMSDARRLWPEQKFFFL